MLHDNNTWKLMISAAAFAANKHRNQRRKDAAATPYINHPLALADLLANEARTENYIAVCAALLHDTIEDTDTTAEELTEIFGDTITEVVLEVTDDKSLAPEVRKLKQIEHAPHISDSAKLVKIADKICNLRDLLSAPPADWSNERIVEYFEWANKVVTRLQVTDYTLNATFQFLYAQRVRFSGGEARKS